MSNKSTTTRPFRYGDIIRFGNMTGVLTARFFYEESGHRVVAAEDADEAASEWGGLDARGTWFDGRTNTDLELVRRRPYLGEVVSLGDVTKCVGQVVELDDPLSAFVVHWKRGSAGMRVTYTSVEAMLKLTLHGVYTGNHHWWLHYPAGVEAFEKACPESVIHAAMRAAGVELPNCDPPRPR